MSVLSLVAALALSATGQRVGTPSITSDLSQSRVTASGSTTARSLRDRAADTVNVKDFGAKGDGVTDDTGAIQAALTAAAARKTKLVFPDGTYNVSAPIAINSTYFGVAIEGANYNGATVKATASMTAVFDFNDDTQNSRFEFSGLAINGNGLAQRGVWSRKISNTAFRRLHIYGTTVSALDVGYGWNNDIDQLEIDNNTGDGIVFSNATNHNAVSITRTRIIKNDGWGIVVNAGESISITNGCDIELNKKGGIFSVTGPAKLYVAGNYFEKNALNGHTFTTPALTVKADIVINGANTTALGTGFPTHSVTIVGNYHASDYATHFVWANATDSLLVEGNYHTHYSAIPSAVVGVYADSDYARVPRVTLRRNENFATEVDVQGIASARAISMTDWETDTAPERNLLPELFTGYTKYFTSGGGTISRSSSANRYEGSEAFEISGVVTSDIWGVVLDVTANPELAGRVAYIGPWTKVSRVANSA
jgi:hypothetical protein